MYRILCGFLLLASSSLASAAPSAVVPEDYYRLTDVSEPTFAPDGGTVAYTVSSPDQARDEKTSDLWTVPWKGGAAKPLTSTPEVSEYSPRYTPDGKMIVFASDHGEHLGDHGLFSHGCSLYRQLVGVPLVIAGPGAGPAGRVVAEPVSLRDISATVVDRLGLARDAPFPGRSLARCWAGDGSAELAGACEYA